jgi:chromosome segregation ATPase
MKTAADNTSTLNESIKSKEQSNKKLEKNIANLNEAIDKKNIKIRSLNEEINKYKAEIDSKNTDIEQLKEQFETGQKDLEQLKNQYSKKLEKQNKIIEKYQRVAKNSVKRYIESQAVRLGVKSDEIINRLPKNYSFNDIDMICEDLQEYKFNMSNLPFGQYGLNEGMKVTAKNISKAPVENPADEITDYDLKIAEAFL